MKNKFIIRIVLIAGLIYFFNSCKVRDKVGQDDRTLIAIVNPTAGSLVGFKSLIDNGVLDIPNAQYLAVCFEDVERDIIAVENFVEEQKGNLFRFRLLKGELSPSDMFKSNQLSDQFFNIFQETDGVFFLGGADIQPTIYKQNTNLLTSITTPNRHLFELSFLFHLLGGRQDTTFSPFLVKKNRYKVIGFCLGMQTMNVATGGSMYQDIPSDIYGKKYVEDVLSMENNQRHLNYWQKIMPDEDMIWSNFHQIKFTKPHHFFNEDLWQTNDAPFVYSSHHQAAQIVGKDFEVIATSADGKVIEIIAHKKYRNVFGVQFHPEVSSLYLSDQKRFIWTPDDKEPKSYYEFLKETNSLQFHRGFWKQVSLLYN